MKRRSFFGALATALVVPAVPERVYSFLWDNPIAKPLGWIEVNGRRWYLKPDQNFAPIRTLSPAEFVREVQTIKFQIETFFAQDSRTLITRVRPVDMDALKPTRVSSKREFESIFGRVET